VVLLLLLLLLLFLLLLLLLELFLKEDVSQCLFVQTRDRSQDKI
jgi:hypothetical protein